MTQTDNHSENFNKANFAGLLVALGIVFGDIGTSVLYAFSAIVGTRTIDETLVLGGFSAIFWTLTLQTTIKYIIICVVGLVSAKTRLTDWTQATSSSNTNRLSSANPKTFN